MICRRFFILVCFLLVGCVPDSVSRLFGSFIERYELENEQIVASEANWFKAFAVDKELMMKVLSDEVGRGFSPWKKFNEHTSVGPNVVYVINGIDDVVFVSRLGNPGNDECIYVNVSKCVIVLMDGRTYGM